MANDEKVWFNVGGMRFWTKWGTLRQPMRSRLSRLSFTDPEYDPHTNEFCFDHSGILFDCILDVHRTGKLHMPHDICAPKMLEEMKFWEIPPGRVACCCWGRIWECCKSVKRVLTLRQTLGTGEKRCERSAFKMQDSSDSGPSCFTEQGFISVLKDLRLFFAMAVDKPFYSRKTKVYRIMHGLPWITILVTSEAICQWFGAKAIFTSE